MLKIYKSTKSNSEYLLVYKEEMNTKEQLVTYGSMVDTKSKKIKSGIITLNKEKFYSFYKEIQIYEYYFNNNLIMDLIKIIKKEGEKELKKINKYDCLLSSTMFYALIVLEELQKLKNEIDLIK